MLATMDSVNAGCFEVLPTEVGGGRIETMDADPPRIVWINGFFVVTMSTERVRLI